MREFSMLLNMEGDQEDDDFQTIKRKKTSSNYSCTKQRSNIKPKRGLSLSQKSCRSKKKACSIRTFLEKEDVHLGTLNDKLSHCPVCQLPFVCLIGQSVEDHVQECIASYSEPSVLCPNGIKCSSTVSCHFTQYSHRQLASLRSVKVAKNKTIQEEISTETNLKSSLSNFIDTNSSNSKTNDICSATPFLISSLPLSTLNSTKQAEQALPFVEDILSMENAAESQTQSSEKENLDDFSHWMDDGFKYEDFDMKSVECTLTQGSTDSPCINTANCPEKIPYTDNTATTLNVITSTIAEKTNTMKSDSQCECISGSVKDKFTFTKSPKTPKRTNKASTKQMDIGVYFGLKPKHKIVTNRSEDVSGKILQPKRFLKEQGDTQCSERSAKKCPFYKIVEGTSFAVDAFTYGHIPDISAYFLSHFHYDHYGGLKRSFSKPIYCSQITANLILLKIKVAARYIHPLSLNTPTVIQNIEVTLLEANHCPGAVMFLFKLPNGQTHLHTGDFRASKAMEENPFLSGTSIHTLYLDTTYCDPSYSFPPQSETVEYCASLATEALTRNAKTLIVVATYTIGKEKIFLAVADALGCKVAVQRDKYNVLQCLESEHLKKIITPNYKEARVHVLPMAHLVHMKLATHLEAYSSQYSELLAFKPTGWTFTDSCEHDLKNIKPSKKASVTIYGVPYSEHSSFNELKQFVQYIKPRKIIPTVNNGSATRREEMKNIFETWLRN